MTNKEFDRWLRDTLSASMPEATPDDWEHLAKRVEDDERDADQAFDDAMRQAVTSLGAESTSDWTRMEHLLDADEAHFDHQVRESIKEYEPNYNPRTWKSLDARLTAEEIRRRRMMTAKILEVAGILLLLLTFYNFYPALREFILAPPNAADQVIPSAVAVDHTVGRTPDVQNELISRMDRGQQHVSGVDQPSRASTAQPHAGISEASTQLNTNDRVALHEIGTLAEEIIDPVERIRRDVIDIASLINSPPDAVMTGATSRSGDSDRPLNALVEVPAIAIKPAFIVGPGPGLAAYAFAEDIFPHTRKQSRVRFGMFAGADINTLDIPEQQFYAQGQGIRFSEKTLAAGGYSAGASLLFDRGRFMVETGLTYSSKTFSPNRKLFIGQSPNQRRVDFENITLNIVSVPLYGHLKLDGKGTWQFRLVGGGALNMIVDAHYDLFADTYIASAAAQDPQQIQTTHEVQRVREHMLDGAKFGTKAYLSVVGGLSIEHFINYRTSIFIQPLYQYQIPFFELIDQDGKHLKSGSLLIGTRFSL